MSVLGNEQHLQNKQQLICTLAKWLHSFDVHTWCPFKPISPKTLNVWSVLQHNASATDSAFKQFLSKVDAMTTKAAVNKSAVNKRRNQHRNLLVKLSQ